MPHVKSTTDSKKIVDFAPIWEQSVCNQSKPSTEEFPLMGSDMQFFHVLAENCMSDPIRM